MSGDKGNVMMLETLAGEQVSVHRQSAVLHAWLPLGLALQATDAFGQMLL